MRDAQGVQMGDGKNHFGCVEPSKVLVKDAMPVELKEEVASVDEIKHQVELARCLQGMWHV